MAPKIGICSKFSYSPKELRLLLKESFSGEKIVYFSGENCIFFFLICKLQYFAKSTFARVEKLASGSCDTQWSNIMAMCFCISTRSSDECSMFPRVRKKLLLFKKTLEVLLLVFEAKVLSFIDENKLRPGHFKFKEKEDLEIMFEEPYLSTIQYSKRGITRGLFRAS